MQKRDRNTEEIEALGIDESSDKDKNIDLHNENTYPRAPVRCCDGLNGNPAGASHSRCPSPFALAVVVAAADAEAEAGRCQRIETSRNGSWEGKRGAIKINSYLLGCYLATCSTKHVSNHKMMRRISMRTALGAHRSNECVSKGEDSAAASDAVLNTESAGGETEKAEAVALSSCTCRALRLRRVGGSEVVKERGAIELRYESAMCRR